VERLHPVSETIDHPELGVTAIARPAPGEIETIGWIDAPMPELLRLSWPIVVSMLSHSMMALVDTLMVSTLGSGALAGVGLGGIVSFILISFPMGVLGGIKILAAQSVGAGRRTGVHIYLSAGLYMAFVMAAIATVSALGVAEVVASVSATTATAEAAKTYLQIGAVGMLPILVRIAVEQARLAMGDSQTPMRVNLLTNIANVALNYLFIFVLDLGVAGAALGTVLANVIGCILIVVIQSWDGYDFDGVQRHHMRSVWRLGFPSGLQFALEMGSFTAMVVMLTNLSELDGAANQIAIQVIHFGFLPCMAIGQAASVMAGQAIGCGRRDLVHTVTRFALIPAGGYAFFSAAVFVIGGSWISAWFTDDPDLLRMATHLLYVAAAFQLADAANVVSRSILQGTGDVRFCAWAGITLSWLMTPPLTWLLAYHFEFGALGGWLGLCLDIHVVTVVFLIRLRGTGWHASADRSLAEIESNGG
jgi:MATE family multidrug resistance protein